ncbi:nickel-responsive transcriptional regulator NikR [Sphingomonas profundi]|uniref:nickel-responsive transcriptional regulator NikR n=1 Tax=Alterirhizorhabdus profundi TaxID=2681549 RepID=UPI0012E8FECF|nr:nickel-responsive transcriptional regulator NikR [Sphingomonas profundi]
MQRITISVSDGFSAALDDIRRDRGYQSRSEAVRDLVRDGIERWREEHADAAFCVANLSYVFDRRVRALAQRLAEMQHEHHDLVAASTAVRLDHFHTMESVMLKGATAAVRAFADGVRAERGVRSGSVNLLMVEANDRHDHAGDHQHHGHAHLSPSL